MGIPNFIKRLQEEAVAKAQRMATDEEYRKRVQATQEIASTFSPKEKLKKIQALAEQTKQNAEAKKQEQQAQEEAKKTDYVPPTSTPVTTEQPLAKSNVAPSQEPDKKKTLMYVGIGVAVLAVVVTTVVLLKKKK